MDYNSKENSAARNFFRTGDTAANNRSGRNSGANGRA